MTSIEHPTSKDRMGVLELPEQLNLFGETRPAPRQWVYAMARLGCLKIGVTSDVQRRARENGALLLALGPGDSRYEHAVHWRFREYRYCHEFFLPAPPVLRWVASLPIQVRPYPDGGPGPILRLAA
jgi:hypothetical protein